MPLTVRDADGIVVGKIAGMHDVEYARVRYITTGKEESVKVSELYDVSEP